MRKEEGIPPPRRFFGDVLSAQKVTRPQAEYPRAAGGRPYGRRGIRGRTMCAPTGL